MTQSRTQKTPGPDHPITITPSSAHVVVTHGKTVVAETDRALELQEASYPPVLYVPLADVNGGVLRDSKLHTWCPYKGEASYHDIVAGTEPVLADVVWYYDDPFPAVAEIKDHVAFYSDRVTVTATPSPPAP